MIEVFLRLLALLPAVSVVGTRHPSDARESRDRRLD